MLNYFNFACYFVGVLKGRRGWS